VVLWLSLLVPSLIAMPGINRLAAFFDNSPFRETLTKGWDSWAIASLLSFKGREIQTFVPFFLLALAVSAVLQLFLTGGILKVLVADVPRPAFRRLIAESAALFKPSLYGFVRFVLTLAIWEALLVGLPVRILTKLAGGAAAAPNVPLKNIAELWMFVVGALVFANVLLRFDLARIALARGDSPTARGAYRVAKERLRDSRASAIGLAVFWFVVFFVVQAVFTNAGIALNPATDAGVSGLFVFRQVGFVFLAMVRVGFWASLLAWEGFRRPRGAWTLQPVGMAA